MSKTISIRVDEKIYDFYKENSEKLKEKIMGLLKMEYEKAKNKAYYRVKEYLDTKLESSNEVTAYSVWNKFRLDINQIISFFYVYSQNREDVVMSSLDADEISHLPEYKLLGLIKIIKKGGVKRERPEVLREKIDSIHQQKE